MGEVDMIKCCNVEAKWVENVVDKGYWFCGECRKEVEKVIPLIQGADEITAPLGIRPNSSNAAYKVRIGSLEEKLKEALELQYYGDIFLDKVPDESI